MAPSRGRDHPPAPSVAAGSQSFRLARAPRRSPHEEEVGTMRMMLRMVMDTEATNPLVASGEISKLMMEAFDRLKPEATYFTPQEGSRCAYIVFDMKDPSQMPLVLEPLFQAVHARVTLAPVMNVEELQKGLGEL